jgi:hypothetical protein
VLAKIRTVDSNGRMVLATGHATPEEHLLLAREGRNAGINVLLTHPGDIPQLPEVARLGAFIEVMASRIYKNEAGRAEAAALIRKIGAEHIIVGTDCGQPPTSIPPIAWCWPRAGCAPTASPSASSTLMYKVNPAKLLGLPPPEATALNK